jgi:hypothetical protein
MDRKDNYVILTCWLLILIVWFRNSQSAGLHSMVVPQWLGGIGFGIRNLVGRSGGLRYPITGGIQGQVR